MVPVIRRVQCCFNLRRPVWGQGRLLGIRGHGMWLKFRDHLPNECPGTWAEKAYLMPTWRYAVMCVWVRVTMSPQTRQSHAKNVYICRNIPPYMLGKTNLPCAMGLPCFPTWQKNWARRLPPTLWGGCGVDVRSPTESLGIPGWKSSTHTKYQAPLFSIRDRCSDRKVGTFCHQFKTCLLLLPRE